MRIGFVCHSSNLAGGGERCTLEAIESLRARGADCRVILPSDGTLAKELAERGFEAKVIPYTWWMSDDELGPLYRLRRLARNFLAVPRVAAALRGWKCDAVYTSTITTPVGAAAARRLG